MGSWRRIRLLFALCALLWGGCPSPAGPPAPPAEIPSLVAFPRTVGIDVSKAGGASALGVAGAVKSQTALTDFSDVISLGPVLFSGFNFLLNTFLDPLSGLEIPVSPTVTTFDGPITFGPGIVAEVKIDFSDHDVDGDGVAEGCTGCTCPTGCAPAVSECPSEAAAVRIKPVCYRIWLRDVGQTEFTRFAAGRFDRYATRDDPATEADEENAGAGSFRLAVEPPPTPDGMRTPLAFGVIYDHRTASEPLLKDTEVFVQDRAFNAAGDLTLFENVHARVAQEDAKKTVKLDFRTVPDPEDGPGLTQYIGRFRDDFDFWSGTFNLQDTEGSDPKTISGETICARISNGAESDQANCLDLGIDVTGEDFLRPAEDADVAFSDFPLSPPF